MHSVVDCVRGKLDDEHMVRQISHSWLSVMVSAMYRAHETTIRENINVMT